MVLKLFNFTPAGDEKYKNVNIKHKLLIQCNNRTQILMLKLNN